MAKIVNMHAAKTHFSALTAEVEAGAEILIARAGKPVMRLVKYEPEIPKRILGLGESLWTPPSDEVWDALDDEVRAMFKDF